ncbi:MAG: Fe-Mn family superoxide dismutase [Thiobacillaceae bacterium]
MCGWYLKGAKERAPGAQIVNRVSASLRAIPRLPTASIDSVDACRAALANAAVTQLGTGWAWLVLDGEKLGVIKTDDADLRPTGSNG